MPRQKKPVLVFSSLRTRSVEQQTDAEVSRRADEALRTRPVDRHARLQPADDISPPGRPTGGRDPQEYAGHPDAVISHRLWLRKFAGEPGVVGERVTFNGVSALTIVGVMPPGFDYPWVSPATFPLRR